MSCIEEYRLDQVRTHDDASPWRDLAGRERKEIAWPTVAYYQPQAAAMGHLHTIMQHTQEHRLVLVSACTNLHITSIYATDLDRFA
jgi:hypothetical protein